MCNSHECLCIYLFILQFPGRRFGPYHPGWKARQLCTVHSRSHPLLPPLRVSHCTWPQTRSASHRSFVTAMTTLMSAFLTDTVYCTYMWSPRHGFTLHFCSNLLQKLHVSLVNICFNELISFVQRQGSQDGRGFLERWWRRNIVKQKRY